MKIDYSPGLHNFFISYIIIFVLLRPGLFTATEIQLIKLMNLTESLGFAAKAGG